MDELCLCTDESYWDMAERQLLERLVYEAVDMNEIRRYCTDTTLLGRVCTACSYILRLGQNPQSRKTVVCVCSYIYCCFAQLLNFHPPLL